MGYCTTITRIQPRRKTAYAVSFTDLHTVATLPDDMHEVFGDIVNFFEPPSDRSFDGIPYYLPINSNVPLFLGQPYAEVRTGMIELYERLALQLSKSKRENRPRIPQLSSVVPYDESVDYIQLVLDHLKKEGTLVCATTYPVGTKVLTWDDHGACLTIGEITEEKPVRYWNYEELEGNDRYGDEQTLVAPSGHIGISNFLERSLSIAGINGVDLVGNIMLPLSADMYAPRIGYGFGDETITRTYPKRCLEVTEPWMHKLETHEENLPKIDVEFPREVMPRERTALRILQKMREAWENGYWLAEKEYI